MVIKFINYLMNNNIFFSISICCLNSESYLEEAITSVLNQTYKNWELILIDNGSVDKTKDIIKFFIKNHSNIKCFTENKKGLSYARNLSIEKSNYDWVVLLDHDDVMHKDRLYNHLQDIQNQKEINFFFGDAIIFKNNKNLYSRFEVAKNKDSFNPTNLNLKKQFAYINLIKYGCFIVSSTVCFNKKIVNSVGSFNVNLKFISDYKFFLNVSEKYDMYCSDKIISKWREHPTQSTNKMKSIYFLELNLLYLKFYFRSNLSLRLKYKIFLKNLRLIYSFIKINFLRK